MAPLLSLSRLIDSLNEWIGKLVIWLVLAAVAISAGNAIVRKALNIICSFAIFPKPFNAVYVVAGLLFFAGLFELQAGKSFWRSNAAKRENPS